MKRLALLLLAAAAAAIAGGTFLARIDYAPGQTAVTVAAAGVTPLTEFNGWCLVRAADAQLSALTGSGFAVTVLDRNTESLLYHYVVARPGFDRSRLNGCGEILTEDRDGVLLRTDEDAVLELNRLPVQLCGIPMEPMVLAEPAPPATVPVSESLVQALVDRVNPDSVLGFIRRLQNFYTRYSTTDSCVAAVQWIQTRFQAYGCDSTGLENYRSNYAPNVIGAKFGTVNRRPIWVICGHSDNTSDYAPSRCPGSDDNASGTAAALEACRVFADVGFDQSVYFIGFTGEEQGLYGSDSFTRRASRRGDSIKAALNFDMISYGRQNIDTFEVIGKVSSPACAWLVDSFIANANRYTTLKTHRSLETNPVGNSDHYSFLRRGYPALMGIEYDFTPVYHEIGDTIGSLYYRYCGTNNVPLATDAIKAAVATIAKFAGAHVLTGAAEPGLDQRPAVLSVFPSVGRPPVRLRFSAPPSAGASLAVYNAAGVKVTSIPVAGVSTANWNGRRADGTAAPAGTYLFRLTGPRALAARAVLVD